MQERIKLYLDYINVPVETEENAFDWMKGADALIIDPCQCDISNFEQMPIEQAVLYSADPERIPSWRENNQTLWVHDDGLEEVARLRDHWQELKWIPRLTVYRPQITYRFSGPALGEGFSFYIPDTAAINALQVTDGDLALVDAITRANELGFSTLWLHSAEAASKAKGLDLDILDKISDESLNIWLSGGIHKLVHLQNLINIGGASAVVVGKEFAQEASIEAISRALEPKAPALEEIPVQFVQCPSQAGQG